MGRRQPDRGTRIDVSDREMRPRRLIGLSVDTKGSYGREIVRGVMEFCQGNPHWQVVIEPTSWLYEEAPRLKRWVVDGVILQAKDQKTVDHVLTSGVPAVNVANMRQGVRSPPIVIPDDEAVGAMAAEHLLALNLPHIAYFSWEATQFSIERGRGFKARAAADGRRVHEYDIASRQIERWVKDLPKPVAIFCCNDHSALAVLAAARRHEFDVPGEVAVLGVDDDELFNTLGEVTLSSIALPAAKIGFEGARLLEARIDGKPIDRRTALPPLCVIARQSTDVGKSRDPIVTAALAYIKANIGRPFQVGDIVAYVKTSRRALERHFQQGVGRSLASTVRRWRVERAKVLLTTTSISIAEVAKASGFTSTTMLGIVFRESMGMSPSTFRERSSCHSPL